MGREIQVLVGMSCFAMYANSNSNSNSTDRPSSKGIR